MYEGACMCAQHKKLPDGTGAGKGWILKKQMEKGRFVLDKRVVWKAQQQTGPTWQPQQQQQQQPQRQQQMADPASEAETVVITPTTAAVAALRASEQCLSGITNTAAETTVPAAAEHIHETAATKWILAISVGTTKWCMTGRGDRKK